MFGFADDLAIITTKWKECKKMNKVVEKFTEITGLELGITDNLKDPKTAWSSSDPQAKNKELKWKNHLIPYMEPHLTYKYLGFPISLEANTLEIIKEKARKYKGIVLKLARRKLPLSMKIEAINLLGGGFMNYYLTPIPPSEESTKLLQDTDKEVIRILKGYSKLPVSFNNGIIAICKNQGGYGLQRLEDLHPQVFAGLIIDRGINCPSKSTRKYFDSCLEDNNSYIRKGVDVCLVDAEAKIVNTKAYERQLREANEFLNWDWNPTQGVEKQRMINPGNVFFGDGSLSKNKTMRSAIYNKEATPQEITVKTIGGPPSSTIAELQAFELMLENATDEPITWVQDSKSALAIIDDILMDQFKRNHKFPLSANRIIQRLKGRKHPIKTVWFPSHLEDKIWRKPNKWKPIKEQLIKDLGRDTFQRYYEGNAAADKAAGKEDTRNNFDGNLNAKEVSKQKWVCMVEDQWWDHCISRHIKQKLREKRWEQLKLKYQRWRKLTKNKPDMISSNPYTIMKHVTNMEECVSSWKNMNADSIIKWRSGTQNLFKYNPKSAPEGIPACPFCPMIKEDLYHFFNECKAYKEPVLKMNRERREIFKDIKIYSQIEHFSKMYGYLSENKQDP